MNTIKEQFHPEQAEWAILSGPNWCKVNRAEGSFGFSEGLVSKGCLPDPRVKLNISDPRVGRLAYWGAGFRSAVVRAVILVDDQEESLLLEDRTGYPWIRVSPDARLVEKS